MATNNLILLLFPHQTDHTFQSSWSFSFLITAIFTQCRAKQEKCPKRDHTIFHCCSVELCGRKRFLSMVKQRTSRKPKNTCWDYAGWKVLSRDRRGGKYHLRKRLVFEDVSQMFFKLLTEFRGCQIRLKSRKKNSILLQPVTSSPILEKKTLLCT